jgi:hypothetical protein
MIHVHYQHGLSFLEVFLFYCTCLFLALRFAARGPAAQGRLFLSAFMARLKPCPDTCVDHP